MSTATAVPFLHATVSELQNRPLPPPPLPDITSSQHTEPIYSPVHKVHQQRQSSPESPVGAGEEVGYSYVRVQMHDGGGIPEDFVFRKLPTPPPDEDDDSEDGEAPVEDAPQEVGPGK